MRICYSKLTLLPMLFVAGISSPSAAGAERMPVAAERVGEHRSVFTTPLELAWENPALLHLRYSTSLTSVKAGALLTSEEGGGFFNADTYLKMSNATVTGYARYENSRRRKGQLTETSDEELVGPYLTSADGDGSMRQEVYTFGGSYTAELGRWRVGISGGYDAGLYYRTVDPRPRNVTGLLQLTPAAAFSISQKYEVAVALPLSKYKQTSSLSFVSELGQNTIHHLTGLGNTYDRFEGQGKSGYYTGHSIGVSGGVMPKESGAYLLAGYSCMSIDHILSDLNNLPLASTSTPVVKVSAGWKRGSWMAGVYGSRERRRGTENIFGDPVSGQYPKICGLTLYSRTRREIGVNGSYRHRNISAALRAGWESEFEQHLSPYKEREVKRGVASLDLHGWLPLRKGGYLGLNLSGSGATRKVTPSGEVFHRCVAGGEMKGEALFPLGKGYMLGCAAGISRSLQAINSGVVEIKFCF